MTKAKKNSKDLSVGDIVTVVGRTGRIKQTATSSVLVESYDPYSATWVPRAACTKKRAR